MKKIIIAFLTVVTILASVCIIISASNKNSSEKIEYKANLINYDCGYYVVGTLNDIHK